MTDYKKELEDFAYIVSHDLNAPMRHIKQFGHILLKKLGDKVTNEERECFLYLEKAVVQTEDMLAALLIYSRLDTTADAFSVFDSRSIVDKALSDLNTSNAEITIGDLPDNFMGDEKQVKQLFVYLLDNALKFRDPIRPLEINISSEQHGSECMFCIQDNGIGIPSAQTKEIFTMFRRVHNNDTYTGIGAGLAYATKIVQMHGGEISAQSNDVGASVVVTLPHSVV